jgi:LPS export ABC transporter protein LptC
LDDTVVTATISADYGVNREKEEMLIAKGNVVVKNMETQEILNTETLLWNQKTKKISTKNMVKITSPDRVVFGDSLTADEDFSKRVIHGIRATIEFEDE